jgi:hypothetical protein
MNIKKRLTPSFQEARASGDVSSTSSSGATLFVTVIATTVEGTTSALNEARRLARDLDAHITLLKIEVVPNRFPLDKRRVSLDFTIKQQCSLVLRSSAREEDVTIRTCFCRDQAACLRSALRRRALVVIGGRRHWWLSREEMLEGTLHRLGHHVIFVDVDHKSGWSQRIRKSRTGNLKQQCAKKMEKKLRIQTVDVCESNFQSMPLCVVDARNSNLQSASSLPKDGAHEA